MTVTTADLIRLMGGEPPNANIAWRDLDGSRQGIDVHITPAGERCS